MLALVQRIGVGFLGCDLGARNSAMLCRAWQVPNICAGKIIVPRTKNGDSRMLFFTRETMASANRFKPTLATSSAEG